MIFDKYELLEAPREEPHAYWVTPIESESDVPVEDQRYRVYDVSDEPFLLAVEGGAPEESFDLVEQEGYEAVWASELERERVKTVKADVLEEIVYYDEEPPENRYEDVGGRDAIEFIQNRGVEGVDIHQLIDTWLYPEKSEFVVMYSVVDDAGEESRVVHRYSELSRKELELLESGESLVEDEESVEQVVRSRADEIGENTALSRSYCEFIAGAECGLSTGEIADIFGRDPGAISSARNRVVNEWEGYRWMESEGLGEVIEEF